MGVLRLSQALVRRGHHVTVVQDIDGFNYLNPGKEPHVGSDNDGVEVVRLKSSVGVLSSLLTQQVGRPVIQGRKIRKVINEGRFDVINFHNISLVGGPGILAAGRSLKLYMAHEHWLVCPSHVLWRHDREACAGPECLRCVLNYKRPPQLWRYTGFLNRQLRHVDAFIAMSEFSRAKHREFGFGRDMEVVNYFLPDTPVGPPPPRNPTERPFFLFVGRLERIKGLDDVIPAFRNYKDADLIIVGDGTHAPVLKKLAAGIPNVKFLGRLAPEALDRYYRSALALIVPSVGFETFGIILIEAFRQSTPVIARRIGPFPEIVNRCRGGELFDGTDELVRVMRRLQTEPDLRQRFANSAREGFEKYWSEAAVIPKYLEVVRKAALAKGSNELVKRIESEAVA